MYQKHHKQLLKNNLMFSVLEAEEKINFGQTPKYLKGLDLSPINEIQSVTNISATNCKTQALLVPQNYPSSTKARVSHPKVLLEYKEEKSSWVNMAQKFIPS